jgi:integrase
MLAIAKDNSDRDYILLLLMRYGLRCGEIVGWRGLPGVKREDLREKGIWVKGKGYARGIVQDRLVPMPAEVMIRIKSFASASPSEDKLFAISEVWAERIVKSYARLAGIEDWQRVGPHRLRAFFATDAKDKGLDAFTIRDLMRHKNITTTNLYVGQSSPDRLATVVEDLATA